MMRSSDNKYHSSRNTYKTVKKYDHQQFDDFCTQVYLSGYKDGKESVPGVDIEKVLKAVADVKGVGPALAGKIRTAVNGLFPESEANEREEETQK